MLRKLTASDVKFSIECLNEDLPIEGNVCCSGDRDEDRRIEDRIRDDYNAGNDWAWCCVKVTAQWGSFTGVDYLGGCSYESESDFCSPGGYFDDMKCAALEDLIKKIEATCEELRALCK